MTSTQSSEDCLNVAVWSYRRPYTCQCYAYGQAVVISAPISLHSKTRMQKQVKSRSPAAKGKFRKAVPMSQKSKGISREVTKNINRKIEKEMTARAGKFNEPMVHFKASAQAVARAGWVKPGNTRGSKA